MISELHSLMTEVVNEHKKTYDADSMRNFTDVYLRQIKESNEPGFNGKLQSLYLFLLV